MENSIYCLQPVLSPEDKTGPFYVLELFPYPHFIIDEKGEAKQFFVLEKALMASYDCKNGYVIICNPLSMD